MANNTKIDELHDQLKNFNTRTNPNWNALVTAIGQEDENIAQLVAAVRQQFFVKTSSRPYLDRLASNSNIVRPKFLGMNDATFQEYIPILSYQPKQVKHIIDQLLNIFFAAESTTAFIVSGMHEPYNLQNGWSLQYTVDQINQENINFYTTDFTNINAATAIEIVSAINRQSLYSYATVDYDNVTKNNYVKIFTNTSGSHGSLIMNGGQVDAVLQFNGFNINAGNGTDTQWTVTKIGQTVSFAWTGGTYPGIDTIQAGDVVIINLPGNIGSFPITKVNLATNSFVFNNLFATVGTFTQTGGLEVIFFTPNKYVAFTQPNRAMVWEPSSDNIVVEMPATPLVVKRSLIGSEHVNGVVGAIQSVNSSTSFTLTNASDFPNSGDFIIQPILAIDTDFTNVTMNTNLIGTPQQYTYTSRTALATSGDTIAGLKQITNLGSTVGLAIGQLVVMDGVPAYATIESIVGTTVNLNYPATANNTHVAVSFLGNTFTGVSPNLPALAGISSYPLSNLHLSFNVVTGITVTNHNYMVGETVVVTGSSPINGQSLNGAFTITSVTDNTFTYTLVGGNGSAVTPGSSEVERIGMANSGSLVILVDSISNKVSRITGSYIWSKTAPFVLSDDTAVTTQAIQAGNIVKLLTLTSNTIPSGGGYVVFDYGLTTQEGPVKYLYAPNNTTLVMDPSYTFLHNHASGTNITYINSLGPHVMSGLGTEYPPYITDPIQARLILENLIITVKSAGIFIDFLIRFPEQFYNLYSTYNQ